MSVVTRCAACQMGEHEKHVYQVIPAPPGVLGGAICDCTGGCEPVEISLLPMVAPLANSRPTNLQTLIKDVLAEHWTFLLADAVGMKCRCGTYVRGASVAFFQIHVAKAVADALAEHVAREVNETLGRVVAQRLAQRAEDIRHPGFGHSPLAALSTPEERSAAELAIDLMLIDPDARGGRS